MSLWTAKSVLRGAPPFSCQGYPFIGGNIVLEPECQDVNMLFGTSDVWAVKAAHFDPERQGVFHYCFSTDSINGGGNSGFSEMDGDERSRDSA